MHAAQSAQGLTTRANFDHLRWVAALAVVLQHARGFVMVDYRPGSSLIATAIYFLTGFSHQAVIVFFVLSGNLVGGTALRMILVGSSSERRHRFVVDRFTRVTVVLWPALALSLTIALVAPLSPILATAGWSADLPNIMKASQASGWITSIVLLNEIVAPTNSFNGPIWSLTYEWTYYVFAAAVIFILAGDRTFLGIMLVIYALCLLVASVWMHPQLLWSISFWLVGAISSGIRSWRYPSVSVPTLIMALILSRFGVPAMMEDVIVALATALLISDRWFQAGRFAAKTGSSLASFSFSLYAVHWPVMLLAVAVAQQFALLEHRLEAGPAAYLAMGLLVFIVYSISAIFAWCTERRTASIRRWFEARSTEARGLSSVA